VNETQKTIKALEDEKGLLQKKVELLMANSGAHHQILDQVLDSAVSDRKIEDELLASLTKCAGSPKRSPISGMLSQVYPPPRFYFHALGCQVLPYRH